MKNNLDYHHKSVLINTFTLSTYLPWLFLGNIHIISIIIRTSNLLSINLYLYKLVSNAELLGMVNAYILAWYLGMVFASRLHSTRCFAQLILFSTYFLCWNCNFICTTYYALLLLLLDFLFLLFSAKLLACLAFQCTRRVLHPALSFHTAEHTHTHTHTYT